MPETLATIFPRPELLLAVEPEELAGAVLEAIPAALQNGIFSEGDLLAPILHGPRPAYEHNQRRPVELAVAEALNWLLAQGLLVFDPGQTQGRFYVQTRRARELKTRADVSAFRKARMLPVELLQPILAEKVWPLFLRGDHDIAVFQAFRVVEVAVRDTANAKGAGYPDDLVGTKLMRAAFDAANGPLADGTLVEAERQAEAHLFAGAIGHAKNPTGHRDVKLYPGQATRLIVFASHLLSIVEQRGRP